MILLNLLKTKFLGFLGASVKGRTARTINDDHLSDAEKYRRWNAFKREALK